MLTEPLLTALLPMIGFRADDASTEQADALTPELKKTTTGVTLDQCHELLQLSILRKSYPKEIQDFAGHLARTREDAIRALLVAVDTKLIEAGLAGQLLKPTQLFEPLSGAPTPIPPLNRTVGLMITPLRRDVTVYIDKLLFSGTFGQGFALKLEELMPDGDPENVVMFTANEWQTDALLLQAGKTYLLTYPEASLGAGNSARNTVSQWPKPKTGCRDCKSGCLSSFVKVEGVMVEGHMVQATRDTNFGINLVFSADGDVSGRLVENPRRLLPALKEQMAMTFLSKVMHSTRKNGQAEEAISMAVYALKSTENAERVPVIRDRAISALVKALSDESSKAIITNNEQSIVWGTT